MMSSGSFYLLLGFRLKIFDRKVVLKPRGMEFKKMRAFIRQVRSKRFTELH